MAGIREQFMTKVAAELPEDIAKDLEKGIYNWSIEQCDHLKVVRNWRNPRFVHLYKDKARSIVSNLLADSSLKSRLVDKELVPHDVPFMKPQDVYPERWADILDLKVKKNKNVFEEKPVSMTNAFKCRKCFSRETTYIQSQTRASDEPLTIHISCINCGNKWQIG